jgi:predicted nucleic acid-binding protein
MTMTFLLDTSVLSECSKPRPNDAVVEFIRSADNLMMPIGTLLEFQVGIALLCAENPRRAIKLSAWFQEVSENVPSAPTDEDVCSVWSTLVAEPRLKNLHYKRPDAKKYWAGQDLHIAAAALVHRAIIATNNVSDFMLINSCHPLPGIYNPFDDTWHARMDGLTAEYIDAPHLAENSNGMDRKHQGFGNEEPQHRHCVSPIRK